MHFNHLLNRRCCSKTTHTLKALVILMAVFLFSNTLRAQYCVPTGMATWSSRCAGGAIINVKFGTLNNSAPCIASSTSSDYYKDLTSSVPPTVIVKGETYSLSVQHSVVDAGTAAVWIDYNRDQVFDASERVLWSTSGSGVGVTLSGNVTVPASAVNGPTRMRVIGLESGTAATNPCAPGSYTEIADYAIIIGGDFYNNAAIRSFQPIPTFCSGPTVTKDIYVRVANTGSNQLNSVQIDWELDGVPQTPAYFSMLIDTLNGVNPSDTLLFLGNVSFNTLAQRTIKAWTAFPNGLADTTNFDDTLATAIKPSVSGNFTIGSTGADYTTIAQAITSLQGGICGPVEFTLAAQTFTGAVNVTSIPGVSATNTITFKGVPGQTVITSSTGTTLNINGVKYVTFRDVAFQTTNASGSSLVNITNSDTASIINCNLRLPVGTSSNWESMNVSGSSGVLIDSCSIKGGYNGIILMGASGDADHNNIIRNCVIDSVYGDVIRTWYQGAITISKNVITSTGNGTNSFSVAILVREGESGYKIEKNKVIGMTGGIAIRTIWCTAVDARSLVANNMIQAGMGANTTIAMQINSENNDVVYNSVEVNSSTTSTNQCFNFNGTGSNNILNNIFKNANPGNIFQISGTNLNLNHNCYYHNNLQTFPYILNSVSYSNFTQLKSSGSDAASIETDPLFVSSTNLRSYNPLLNAKAQFFAAVETDIDDSLRHISTPDIGINEFDLPPREDAGVVAIVNPSAPVTQGAISDVGVVIRNLGVGTLTSVNVTYLSGSTIYSQLYTGSLEEGETDTVVFDALNGSSLLIPSTGGFSITAWTSQPNNLADTDFSNDTFEMIYCEPMSGIYTINATGSGARNFTSFNEAVNSIVCGGVNGAVMFEASAGTYNERISIPYIAGSSSSNTITFTSASGIKTDVLLADSATHDTNNYVVIFAGTSNVHFKNMSLSNRGTDFSRVFVYKVTGGVINDSISVTGCDIRAKATTVNSINTALFFGGSEENRNLIIVNNVLTNGSSGINISGLPSKNQYSSNIVVNDNTFTDHAFNSVVLSFREGVSVRRNTIVNTLTTTLNGISVNSTSGNVVVASNRISLNRGAGINVYQNAYYNEPGTALVTSNSIHMTGTGSLAQQGIKVVGGTKVELYNNTIKLESSNAGTANAGLHLEGDIAYVNLLNTASYGFKIQNNIIHTENGYPVNVAEIWFNPASNISRTAIAEINNNLYYNNSGTNVAKVVTTDYDKTNFDGYKTAINFSSDQWSHYVKVPFASNSLKPLENDTIAWWINGRAVHVADVTNDVAGNTRATVPNDGVPDIGAYEITPSVLPPLAVAVPATAVAGSMQAFLFMGDTIAKIYYDQFAQAPASVAVRQFVGERPPQIGANEKFMYHYVSVEMPAVQGYYYNVDLMYNDAWTGTMSNNETGIRMIAEDGTGVWSMVNTSSVNDVNNVLSGSFITGNKYVFTGTDPNDPLPVKLTAFNARKSGAGNVEVSWNTASEKNASHFIVDRSVDAVNFEQAGKVSARNAASSYRFNDDISKLNVPAVYYRLTSVDRDGSRSVSKVVKITFDNVKTLAVTLAPNPVRNNLNVYLGEVVNEPVTVSVYGLQGEKISERTYQSVSGISENVSELTAGLYFVKVAYGNVVKTIRFTKY